MKSLNRKFKGYYMIITQLKNNIKIEYQNK